MHLVTGVAVPFLQQAHGFSSAGLQHGHITFKELVPIVVTCAVWGHLWKGMQNRLLPLQQCSSCVHYQIRILKGPDGDASSLLCISWFSTLVFAGYIRIMQLPIIGHVTVSLPSCSWFPIPAPNQQFCLSG
jgi:hypothetical protein